MPGSTRFKAIFKVCDMALYTPKKVASVEELLALPGAKRLQFTALRELPGTELGRLFIKGMAENTSTDVMLHHTVSTTRCSASVHGTAHTPAFASTTTDTPRAPRSASAFWYECARLPGKASTSPSASV